MGMTFNEFQRELKRRNIDGPIAMVLTAMYEQQRETAEQVHQCATIIEELVGTVASFVSLNEAMSGHVKDLTKRVNGETDGVGLSSVPLRDEPN